VTNEQFNVTLEGPSTLSQTELDACFHLIETTSAEDYKKSKAGWKPRSKRKEMKLLDLKYLLVKRDNRVEGFLSLMPTYEDDYPVIYCYEVHLSPASEVWTWDDSDEASRVHWLKSPWRRENHADMLPAQPGRY